MGGRERLDDPDRFSRAVVEAEVEAELDRIGVDEPERGEVLRIHRDNPFTNFTDLNDAIFDGIVAVYGEPIEEWSSDKEQYFRAMTVRIHVNGLRSLWRLFWKLGHRVTPVHPNDPIPPLDRRDSL